MYLVFKLMFSNQTDWQIYFLRIYFYFICVLYRGFNIVSGSSLLHNYSPTELRVAFHICKNAYTLILQYFLLPNKLLSVCKDFILDAAPFEWTKVLCIKKKQVTPWLFFFLKQYLYIFLCCYFNYNTTSLVALYCSGFLHICVVSHSI